MNRFIRLCTIAIAAIAVMTISSCSDDQDLVDGNAPREPIVYSEELRPYVEYSHAFALNLWDAINAMPEYESSNFIVSPLSIQMNMSILANGASGATLDEFLEVLLPGCEKPSLENLNQYQQLIREGLAKSDAKAKLSMASGVFFDESVQLSNEFTSRVNQYYASSTFNFKRNTESGMSKINDWISNATSGNIRNYLSTPPKSVVMLINALLFQHTWSSPFEKSNTKNEDFYCESGKVIKVPMMYKSEASAPIYAHHNSYRLMLSYGNGAFTLHLFKPDDGYSVNDVMQRFGDGEWYNRRVNIKLPKFSLETDIDFKELLRSMGMEESLSASADYSALCSLPVEIEEIKQKTKIELDEEGTKVVATSSASGGIGAPGPPPPVVDFFLDHPFAFMLQGFNGEVLAIGKICEF